MFEAVGTRGSRPTGRPGTLLSWKLGMGPLRPKCRTTGTGRESSETPKSCRFPVQLCRLAILPPNLDLRFSRLRIPDPTTPVLRERVGLRLEVRTEPVTCHSSGSTERRGWGCLRESHRSRQWTSKVNFPRGWRATPGTFLVSSNIQRPKLLT